jgi:hypothetical protein
MPLLVCQNCGFHQNDGTICRSCRTPFFYHPGSAADGPVNPPKLPQVEAKRDWSMFRRVYRIVNYATFALLIIAILLVLHKSRPPQVTADPQAAQRAESKIEASASAAESGQPEPLHLDSSEVNSLLHQDLALGSQAAPAPTPNAASNPPQASPTPTTAAPDPTIEEVQSSVKDVKVTMHDDQVEAYVVFNFHGEDLSLDLEGKLGVNDGVLQFQPTQGTLGSLPVPQAALDDAVQKMLGSPENREKLKLPANIRDLRIQNGELVVDYK